MYFDYFSLFNAPYQICYFDYFEWSRMSKWGNENQEKPFNVALTCQIWQVFRCNSMQIISQAGFQRLAFMVLHVKAIFPNNLTFFRRYADKQLVVESRVWSERQRAYKDPTGDKVIGTGCKDLLGFWVLGTWYMVWVLSTRIQLGTRWLVLGTRIYLGSGYWIQIFECWVQGFNWGQGDWYWSLGSGYWVLGAG